MTIRSLTPLAYPALGAIISRVQSRFIRAAPTAEVFDPLLTDLLEFTLCEYGFIAEVLHDPGDGHPFVRMTVLTDISWNTATQQMYERHRSGEQRMEFHNLNTLFGAAVLSREPVIANDPPSDPRSGGLPRSHPNLESFLAVPLFHGGDMVGLVGLANRPGGFDETLVEFLRPLFASIAAIIGAVRMDQARRSAEQALRESEERLRNTFEMAAVGIAHVAPEGRILRVNKRLCDTLGYSRDEMLAMRFHDITWPEDLPDTVRQAQRLLDGEIENYTIEKRYRHKSGSVVWASLTVALVREPDGRPAYFVSVLEDVTGRKQAEAALLAARAAERANAAKTEFLSRMSHELRTPLNAVLGFAQLLQMDATHPLAPEQQARVHHIENAGAHLLAMINDVLDLSRIESGGMTLAPETVALRPLVQESLALVDSLAQASEVLLRVEPPPDSAAETLHADHLRLRQVLVNLLSNAIKYNRRGGSVTVRWTAPAEDGRIAIRVSDTGQGLSAEQREHLFEPFNRLGAERTGIEGTGIGLVVTHRLVLLMGGTLEVESRPGVGSCFAVHLPAAPSNGKPAAASTAGQGSAPAQPGASRTVLYAEDNPMNVELVREVLSLLADVRLVIARNGREALSLAHSERPELLLLDMHLGDMSGLDVKAQLDLDPALAKVPCIALSADAMPEPIEAAKRAGFCAYLTKPLEVGAFLRTVDEVLRGRAQGIAPSPPGRGRG
ncbi:MAG TPA: PAS domain S-box protein [Albitalea sp.]|nr:PAS domain S-box protein [Albitalea sp.]